MSSANGTPNGGVDVGYVSKILAGEQVEYRLKEGAGCAGEPEHAHDSEDGDAQVDYRLAGEEELPLVWLGEGLREFGIIPGSVMTDEQKDWARALMDGAHPITGEQLVDPIVRTAPAGKLPTAPLIAAIDAAAEARGVTPAAVVKGYEPAEKRLASATRMVAKQGEAHRISFKDAAMLAEVARVDLTAVYGAAAVLAAKANANERVRIGTRGYDLTIALNKGESVLYGLAGGRLRGELDAAIAAGVDRMLAQITPDVVYGMKGHHGDGKRATRVSTGGMIGWRMDHRTARPVQGKPPDPHAHVHIVFANLALGADGVWRTIAAGGKDLMRHARLADELVKHEIRGVLLKHGARYERDAVTGEWELAAIPRQLREEFSKRSAQAAEELAKMGVTTDEATPAQRRMANAKSRQGKGSAGSVDLDEAWRAQARAAAFDPDTVLAAALPGWPEAGPLGDPHGPGPGPAPGPLPDLGELAARVFDPVHGLTAHRKVITKVDVLAEVTASLTGGQSIEQIVTLTEDLLASEHVVRLPEHEIRHLSNAARYTTPDIVAAENTILDSTRARFFENAAALPVAAAEMAIATVEATLGFELSGEQKAFVTRALTRGLGIEALVGTAGAGKTALTTAIRAAYEAHGMTVRGATLAAVAGAHLQSESAIPTMTIAGWVQQIQDQRAPGLRGVDVLVVDEAAMADDRQLAVIVAEAEQTGTKLILTGDHLQLRSPGVGGAFKAVHELVGGLALTDNRRQVDQAERETLAKWRTGKRREVLTDLSSMGRVHVAESAADAYAQILTRYRDLHGNYPDPHQRIAHLAVLAGTNEAANRINAGVRAILRADGLLPAQERAYRLAGGGRIAFSIGDQVMLRTNDYRTRKDPSSNDVLNGYRGVVVGIDQVGNVQVEWMKATPAGPARATEWITPGYIARGGLSHAYALTVAKSQGLTCDQALVYGAGLDAHTLYAALTRARHRTDLILPRLLIETPERQLELGEPVTPAEALARAVHALADHIEGDRPEDVVVRELGALIEPITPAETANATPTTVTLVPATAEQIRARDNNEDQAAADEPAWRARPAGRLSDREIAELLRRYRDTVHNGERIAALTEAVNAGRGPEITRLREQAPILREQAAAIRQARAARRQHDDAAGDLRSADRRLASLRDQFGRLDALTGITAWRSRAERRDLQSRIAAAETERVAAAARVDQLRGRRDAADQAVADIPESQWTRITEQHDRNQRDWPGLLRAAQDQDNTSLITAPMMLNADPDRVARARRYIPILRAEQQLRAAMPPEIRAAEDHQRAEAAEAEAAERAAARRAAPRRPGPQQPHRPHTVRHPGPQPGQGLGR